MACMSKQTGECSGSDWGSRLMDVSCPESPRLRLGGNQLCCHVGGMCKKRKFLYCVCRGLRDRLLKLRLLTSFQVQYEQECHQSWTYLRTAVQGLIRAVSLVNCL